MCSQVSSHINRASTTTNSEEMEKQRMWYNTSRLESHIVYLESSWRVYEA